MAVIALMMTISASAQFYIYYSDGTVAKVDSISLVAPEDPNTPQEPEDSITPPTGISVFSVSESKQVIFSKGNLQYARFTNTWSFAENQWDVIGTDNVTGGSVSSDEWGDEKSGNDLADKIDLFGWSGSTGDRFGISSSTDDKDYTGTFVDWGTNEIDNDPRNTWRTLTSDEWNYVMFNRPNASSLNGIAQVNGVNGLILLPDNWICPKDVRFKSGFHIYDEIEYYAANQTFTAYQWSLLEAAGAIFLPASGTRYGSSVHEVQYAGYYWSASEGGVYPTDNPDDPLAKAVYILEFYPYLVDIDEFISIYRGYSVRLVKDL